jgi:hypothetical protein
LVADGWIFTVAKIVGEVTAAVSAATENVYTEAEESEEMVRVVEARELWMIETVPKLVALCANERSAGSLTTKSHRSFRHIGIFAANIYKGKHVALPYHNQHAN